MPQISQTRPLKGRAGRDQLGRSSRSALTLSEFRAQLISARFHLCASMASEVSRHALGEVTND